MGVSDLSRYRGEGERENRRCEPDFEFEEVRSEVEVIILMYFQVSCLSSSFLY
jgi:hypothetical protein